MTLRSEFSLAKMVMPHCNPPLTPFAALSPRNGLLLSHTCQRQHFHHSHHFVVLPVVCRGGGKKAFFLLSMSCSQQHTEEGGGRKAFFLLSMQGSSTQALTLSELPVLLLAGCSPCCAGPPCTHTRFTMALSWLHELAVQEGTQKLCL